MAASKKQYLIHLKHLPWMKVEASFHWTNPGKLAKSPRKRVKNEKKWLHAKTSSPVEFRSSNLISYELKETFRQSFMQKKKRKTCRKSLAEHQTAVVNMDFTGTQPAFYNRLNILHLFMKHFILPQPHLAASTRWNEHEKKMKAFRMRVIQEKSWNPASSAPSQIWEGVEELLPSSSYKLCELFYQPPSHYLLNLSVSCKRVSEWSWEIEKK